MIGAFGWMGVFKKQEMSDGRDERGIGSQRGVEGRKTDEDGGKIR